MNAGAHGRSISEVLARIELFRLDEGDRSAIPAAEAGFSYRRSGLPHGAIVIGATVALGPGDPTQIRSVMDEARAWRRATQPLAEPNCGSVFKNPPDDHAGRLIEAVGGKGTSVGGASVSTKHANFIVAGPGANAEDVWRLIRSLQERVEQRFGISLELEVQLVGDFDLAAI